MIELQPTKVRRKYSLSEFKYCSITWGCGYSTIKESEDLASDPINCALEDNCEATTKNKVGSSKSTREQDLRNDETSVVLY